MELTDYTRSKGRKLDKKQAEALKKRQDARSKIEDLELKRKIKEETEL